MSGWIQNHIRDTNHAGHSFDEVHFGKFAGFYLKRTYFFDVHPPLAKLMLAGMGWLIGYDGHFDFANIGDSYIENNVPYIGLRTLPATLNVLCVVLLYNIMRESGYAVITCALTASMYLLGKIHWIGNDYWLLIG